MDYGQQLNDLLAKIGPEVDQLQLQVLTTIAELEVEESGLQDQISELLQGVDGYSEEEVDEMISECEQKIEDIRDEYDELDAVLNRIDVLNNEV